MAFLFILGHNYQVWSVGLNNWKTPVVKENPNDAMDHIVIIVYQTLFITLKELHIAESIRRVEERVWIIELYTTSVMIAAKVV